MSAEREIPAEDSIKVVCRFRPLNDSEERAGSKFVVKFPNNAEENCISIAVIKQNISNQIKRYIHTYISTQYTHISACRCGSVAVTSCRTLSNISAVH